MLGIIFLLLHLSMAVFVFFLCLAFVTGAPFVPSSNPTAQTMIALAQIRPGMTVYDLGSGEGRLLSLAAHEGATAIGYEINPFLLVFTKAKLLFHPQRQHIQVKWQNFWTAKLAHADVVFVYLLPWKMDTLQRKLTTSLTPGTLVVSNSFIFPDWKILRQDSERHVYVFAVPRKKDV